MIEFFIDCVPPTTTAQQKGVSIVARKGGHALSGAKKFMPRFFKKGKVEAAEQQYLAYFWPKRPTKPMQGALRMEITFIFPWRQADLKKRLAGKLPAFVIKDTKPDHGNVLKLPEDVMTACRFWEDDGQIGECLTRKGWGDRTGVHVKVSPCVSNYMPPEMPPSADTKWEVL